MLCVGGAQEGGQGEGDQEEPRDGVPPPPPLPFFYLGLGLWVHSSLVSSLVMLYAVCAPTFEWVAVSQGRQHTGL